MKELISIIVPIYNTEKYLHTCLDSIINQTYGNLEILLINDGSIDHSLEICNEYAKNDKRIKVINKKNTGVSDTRNIGIQKAKGKYIMFVDSDDILNLNCCKKLLEINSNNSEIVIGNIEKTSSISNSNKVIPEKKYYFNNSNKKNLILTIYNNIYQDINYTEGPVAKIYNREFLIKNNLKFNHNLKYGEDGIFNLQCYIKANNIILTNEILYYYIINPNSASSGKNYDFKNQIFELIETHKEILKDNKLYDKYKNDYYIFCFRQILKILKRTIFCNNKDKRKDFYELLKSAPVSFVLKNIDFKKLSFKDKIKYIILKNKMYFVANLIWKYYFRKV